MSTSLLRAFTVAALLAAAIVVPRPSSAQVQSSLDVIEAAMAAGRLTEARETLERWHRTDGRRAGGEQLARALLLEARLATDFETARDAFLGIVLAHPSSAAAPEALLRLGQGLDAAGEHARAAAYLERLAADYPGAPQRAEGLLWLARAYRHAGQRAQACASAQRAAEPPPQSGDLMDLIDRERAAACGAAAAADASNTPTRGGARGDAAIAATASAAPRFSVQAGAFHERAGAERIARLLLDAGFDARIVVLDGSALHHVRVGRFETARDAAVIAGRLTALGYSIIIVNDALHERS